MPLEYGQKFAVGLLILVVGLWLAGAVSRGAQKLMAGRKFDAALQSFLGSMINYSTEATRRVDWTIGIGYGDDADKAQEVLLRSLPCQH